MLTRINSRWWIWAILPVLCIYPRPLQAKDAVDYIDPFIGTGHQGKDFPGATTPLSMVKLSPDTGHGGLYYYSDSTIQGFSFTHLGGADGAELGNVLVSATTGPLHTFWNAVDKVHGYSSSFVKSSEQASAGYYAVTLADYQIRAEATAAPHSGMLRFTFPANEQSRIQIDLSHRNGGSSFHQTVKVVDDHTIEGEIQCKEGWGGWTFGGGCHYNVFYHIEFSKPFTKTGVWSATRCEEHDANDNTVRHFLDQGEQINGTPYFYSGDQLFSIREMTDSAGALHARYNYDPYGTRTKVSGDLDASRGFTGHYYHAPSGLHLTMYRAYDSQTGRWLSRDPLPGAESSQGPNLFEYVANDPIKNSDPFGTSRTLHFYGHSYITVDVWDSCCQHPSGKRYLDFAPGFGQRSDFRNLPSTDPDIVDQPGGITWTINSTCEQDKTLVDGWQALLVYGGINYNVYPNNCITIAFTMFTYGIN